MYHFKIFGYLLVYPSILNTETNGGYVFILPLKHEQKEESIPVGCLLPACQPYVLQWPPDVSTGEQV